MNNLDNAMQWRGFKSFLSLDVNTGKLSEPILDLAEGVSDGLIVYDYILERQFNNLLDMTYNPSEDMLYTTEGYQKDANTDAVSIIHTIDKATGKLTKVTTINDQIQYFCFDIDGNMWAITPYWKETGQDEKVIKSSLSQVTT